MRLITLDECAELTDQLFDRFVMPLAVSNMTGEIPSIHFGIHRHGTKERDWLAHIRYKHTMTISVFQCDVWLEDIFRLCRRSKLWLITKEVYQIAALYAMLHPIYQTECMHFDTDTNTDYDAMMAEAGEWTYRFIKNYYPYTDEVQPMVLEILRHHMADYAGKTEEASYRSWQRRYEQEMLAIYEEPYRVARARKANTSLLDYEGFIKLERLTEGVTRYEDSGIKESALEVNRKREEGYPVPEETEVLYDEWELGTNEERGFTHGDIGKPEDVSQEEYLEALVDAMEASDIIPKRRSK